MESLKALRKIGKPFLCAWAVLAMGASLPVAHASGAVTFTAEVDRAEIAADESVTLIFSVEAEGGGRMGDVEFQAPDFDVVNEYSSSMTKSYYDNGRFGMTVTQKLSKVLRPSRTGSFSIRQIKLKMAGRVHTAPDLRVTVGAAGAGTPPPRRYGGGGVGLRGAAKSKGGPMVMVKAEVNKNELFKGEQLVVSYYLYRRVPVYNISADKFPELKGFLKEELQMPIVGQSRLQSERVLLDGVAYERSLLVRYGAYPLQEGKLKVDPMVLKLSYQGSGGSLDDDDPFLGMLRQMTPRTAVVRSDVLTLDVLPLPSEGRPSGFSGGVGDFSVTSAVDKYEVRANEAVTMTVKVEGRGNVAAISQPKTQWPDGVELYDSKGKSKTGAGGVGEKVFEILLIPRSPGKVTLPPVEFSFFDPAKRAYVARATEKTEINVLPPAPGTSAPVNGPSSLLSASSSARPPSVEDIRYLRPPGSMAGGRVWNWAFWAALAGSVLLIGFIGFDALTQAVRGSKAALRSGTATIRAIAQALDTLKNQVRKASVESASFEEVSKAYDAMASAIFSSIDSATSVGARSMSRSDLLRLLTEEHGFNENLANRIGNLLEFADTVRYAASLGAVSERTARNELGRWLAEAESLVRSIEKVSG